MSTGSFSIKKWGSMRNDIIFTTVCISDPALDEARGHFRGEYYYTETANILVNSVLKNTNHNIIVVTDVPEKFIRSDRVIVHDIRQLSSEPKLINRYMNFHLKRYAMKLAFESSYKYTVYLDCDLFIEKFNEDIFDWMDVRDVDVAGKLGVTTIDTMQYTSVGIEKIQQFGPHWNDDFLNATLPFELFLIFKKNEKKQKLFMDLWNRVALESLNHDITTLYDSYYIGTSIQHSQMNKLNLQQSDDEDLLNRTDRLFDGIRVIHAGHVCTFDIVQLEKFSYKTLMDRISYAV